MTPEPNQTEITEVDAKSAPTPWLRPELVASWREIVAVLILVTGYYVYGSAEVALYRWNGHVPHFRETNYHELHLMAGESTTLALFLLFLRWRGWKTTDLQIKVSWWSTVLALPLLVINLVITIIGIYFIIRWNISHPSHVAISPLRHATAAHLNWLVLVPTMIVNAYLEEVTCICYAFNQFAAKRGPLVAMILMLLLRISCHTWKSPAQLGITVIGFSLYGLWYWRTRNVWPLILTHICFDLVLLYPQVR